MSTPLARFRNPTAEDFAAAGFKCDKKVGGRQSRGSNHPGG